MAESKRGRPPMPAHERRDKSLAVRFSAKDLEEVRKQAKAAGMSIAAWVRRRLKLPK